MYSAIQDDLEIVGIVNHRPGSVATGPQGADFDPAYIRQAALSQEAAGYDRVLIANAAVMPESFATAAHLSGVTSKLGFMMAHRPGPVQPTYAARHLATLDRLSEGRAAVHIIAGADDREVQADGAFNTKEERYRIAAEYVEVMRRVWASEQPFDFDGEYYRYRDAFAMVRPAGGAMPVYWGGTSDLALDLCGKVADVYALGGDTFAGAGALARKAHEAAARHGREIKVLMTMVILLGETEDAAWARAGKLYEQVTARSDGAITMGKHDKDEDKAAAGAFQRMLAQSKEGERLDRCLWTGLNKAFKGRGNNSVLVGTPQQVADSLMEYRRQGITRFLLRSPDQDADAAYIGGELVPELKAQMAAAKVGA
ncbi:LLM class flavin-dependent oxidoreductase [Novosphingobium profundi]|uniref:LLM class flavin-dependent oxidoreductase n=1 Tax=Novosphingobium profundi TaxID=1774954 RepID=UPI001BDA0E47|nr:LLM class flavin-dependent oxidoreductase [Novosphingobium profundi]MBT0668258.1 LLM class flavin-dependent oxidoreductase [Novosphingobium profundi]